MAARRSLGTLTLDLVANLNKFTPGMNKAQRETDKAMRSIDRSIKNASRSLTTFLSVAAFRSATQSVQKYSDEYVSLNNRLKVATATQEEYARAQQLTFDIAQDTRAQLASTAELYQRLALSTQALNLSQDELADLVTTVNKSLVISGSSVQGANAAIIQLGQGLAAGAVRGQEFNSVAEQAPRLLTALADGIEEAEGNIGKLRALANTGFLTPERVVGALQSQFDIINTEFEKASVTIGQANTRVRNSVVQLIGEQLEATDSSQQLIGALDDLRTLLEDPGIAEGLGTIAAALVSVSTFAIDALSSVIDFTEGVSREVARAVYGLSVQDEVQREIDAIDKVLNDSVFFRLIGGRLVGFAQGTDLFGKTEEELRSLRKTLVDSLNVSEIDGVTKPFNQLNQEAERLQQRLTALEKSGQGSSEIGQKLVAQLTEQLANVEAQIAVINEATKFKIELDSAALDAELATLEGKVKAAFILPERSKEAETLIENLREQIEVFDAAAGAAARYKARIAGGNDDQQQEAASLAQRLELLKEEKRAREEVIERAEAAAASSRDFIEAIKEENAQLQFRLKFGEDNIRANLEFAASQEALSEAQKQSLETLIAEREELEKRRKEMEAQADINDEALRLQESLKTEEEAIQDRYDREKKIIEDATNFTIAERDRLLEALAQKRDEDLLQTARAEQLQSLLDSLKTEEEMIQESYERRKQLILDNTLAGGEAQTELLLRLETDRQAQLAELQMNRIRMDEELFGNLAGLAKAFAGEQSGIYKALFAVEKAAGIARSIIAIQTAIAQAAASGPFPANLAAMASVASATAGLVSTISSTGIQGVAHNGLMEVPTTGTYLLEKGERVTTEKTSAKLDRTLDQVQQKESSSSGAATKGVRIVNAFDTAVIGDYLGSAEGEDVILNTVRRNQATIREVANG